MIAHWWERRCTYEDPVSALVSGGASILGGVMSSNSASDAAQTQADAANTASAAQLQATRETNALQQGMYDQARADQAPWRAAGSGAVTRLSQLLGIDTPSNPNAASNVTSLQKQYNDALTTYNNLLNSSSAAAAAQPMFSYSPNMEAFHPWNESDNPMYFMSQIGAYGQGGGSGNQAAIDAAKANLDSLKAQIDSANAQSQQMAPRSADFGSFNKPFSISDFQADPGYEFTRQQGELALDRANAAKGRYASGAALKDLLSFNSGLANQTYNDAFNRYQTDLGNRFGRLSSLAGLGQSATSQVGQLGNSTAANIASNTLAGTNASNNALLSGAASRASGYVGSTNALTGGLNNAASMYMLSKLPMFNQSSSTSYGNAYAGFDNPANYG